MNNRLYQKAKRLRKRGWNYSEIGREIGFSSGWTRQVILLGNACHTRNRHLHNQLKREHHQ